MMIDELAVVATQKLMIERAERNARASQVDACHRRRLFPFAWFSRRVCDLGRGGDVRGLATDCVNHDIAVTVKPIREPAP